MTEGIKPPIPFYCDVKCNPGGAKSRRFWAFHMDDPPEIRSALDELPCEMQCSYCARLIKSRNIAGNVEVSVTKTQIEQYGKKKNRGPGWA
jgi:sulfatase maturation enzyme AslB (radical SAM superfamily)